MNCQSVTVYPVVVTSLVDRTLVFFLSNANLFKTSHAFFELPLLLRMLRYSFTWPISTNDLVYYDRLCTFCFVPSYHVDLKGA